MDPSSELLSQLEGLDLPAATGLGIAPGWWLLLLSVLLVLAALYFFRQPQIPVQAASDWRPQAQQELSRIRQSITTASPDTVLSDCSRIARRMALAVLPREDVASLHGQTWMLKLDELSQTKAFSAGPGRLLLTGPYQKASDSKEQAIDKTALESLIGELESLFQTISGASS